MPARHELGNTAGKQRLFAEVFDKMFSKKTSFHLNDIQRTVGEGVLEHQMWKRSLWSSCNRSVNGSFDKLDKLDNALVLQCAVRSTGPANQAVVNPLLLSSLRSPVKTGTPDWLFHIHRHENVV